LTSTQCQAQDAPPQKRRNIHADATIPDAVAAYKNIQMRSFNSSCCISASV
jgi:hypothetical protein